MNKVFFGDCRAVMRELIAQGVKAQTCVTSPPYWGLRDYGAAGQLGLERLHDCLGWATGDRCGECHVCNMVEVFRLVRELLADDGTCWVNYGDSYVHGGCGARDSERWPKQARNDHTATYAKSFAGLKPKDQVGMPWRIALALQADGWYLRQDIIWHKPNPMPESVRDRCTKAHEYVFLLSKSERYFFDQAAIAEPAIYGRTPTGVGFGHGYDEQEKSRAVSIPSGWDTSAGSHRELTGRYERESQPKGSFDGKTGDKAFRKTGETRNKRTVWTIPTKPYSEAHFATYPPELIEPCILAGSRPGDIVFDPFFGSGTTGEVAERLGRQWIGTELNEAYGPLQKKRTAQIGMAI